jgi:hypothetical protein
VYYLSYLGRPATGNSDPYHDLTAWYQPQQIKRSGDLIGKFRAKANKAVWPADSVAE